MFFICETCCSSFSMIVQQISAIEPPRCLDRKMLYRLVQTDDSSTVLSHWLKRWLQVTCVTWLHSCVYTGTVFVWQHDCEKKKKNLLASMTACLVFFLLCLMRTWALPTGVTWTNENRLSCLWWPEHVKVSEMEMHSVLTCRARQNTSTLNLTIYREF